jgi:hypothetical protein
MQFRVIIAMTCRVLRHCIDVNYVVGHECISSVSFQCIMFVSTDNILMWWKCVVYYIKAIALNVSHDLSFGNM